VKPVNNILDLKNICTGGPAELDLNENIVTPDHAVSTYQHEIFFQRIEANFTSALDKICTQQSELFNAKFQLMEEYYTKSLKSNDDKIDKLLGTVTKLLAKADTPVNDKLHNRISSLEKENVELKTSIQGLQNSSQLLEECWKSKLETQKTQMEFSKRTQVKHVKDMQAELNNLSDKIHFKDDQIQDMEANLHMLSEKLQSKEDELYSLEQH